MPKYKKILVAFDGSASSDPTASCPSTASSKLLSLAFASESGTVFISASSVVVRIVTNMSLPRRLVNGVAQDVAIVWRIRHKMCGARRRVALVVRGVDREHHRLHRPVVGEHRDARVSLVDGKSECAVPQEVIAQELGMTVSAVTSKAG